MSSYRYKKGAAAENALVRYLRRQPGTMAFRTPGSRGAADVVQIDRSTTCRNKAAYERAKPKLKEQHAREKQARIQHRFRQRHRHEIGIRQRATMKMFGRIWGLNGSRNSKPSEDFAANLLPRMGFTKVRSLIPYRKSFPFDLAAEKDGRPAFVEVTTNRMHHNNKRFELAQDLGFDLYFLFLRPALDGYYLVHATESKFSYYIPYPVLRRREWNRID